MTFEPESPGSPAKEWWDAVRSIADLIHRDGVGPDEDTLIREELTTQGFSKDGIGKAMDWVRMASLSGNLMDTLGMLQPPPAPFRVEHPLERSSLHPGLVRAVESCRRQGFITTDLAERLIEGLRTMDTRDWDQTEIHAFFADVLMVSSPWLAGQDVAELLKGKPRDQHN